MCDYVASDSPFDYLLKEPRLGKVNIRTLFCYSNIVISSIALITIMVLKIMLHMSGQDANAFDTQTTTSKGRDFSTMVSGHTRIFFAVLPHFCVYGINF